MDNALPKNLYIISGINIYDYAFFMDEILGETKIYVDIPYDWGKEGHFTPFNACKEYLIIEKEKGIVKELYKTDTIDKKSIEKKTKINTLGTSVLIKYRTKKTEILSLSENDIMNCFKKYEKLNDVYMFVSVHDFDWRAICYFENLELYNRFITWIKSQTKIEFIDGLVGFPT